MYTLVYRVLNDHDDAHDALQEGFIDVFRDLHQFRGGSLHGWIKTIMVRKALRRLRLEKRFEPLDSDTAALPQLIHWPDHITGPLLDQAIRALPPGYRAVFTMIEIEGFSHKETAQLLNISEGTSKSQLYHAKKQLQAQLKSLLYRSGFLATLPIMIFSSHHQYQLYETKIYHHMQQLMVVDQLPYC